MMRLRTTAIAIAASTLLTACGTVRDVNREILAKEPETRSKLADTLVLGAPSRVVEKRGTRLSATEVAYSKNSGAWLKTKTVSLNAANPMSLTQVVAKFAANGINISSDLPLDSITYVGTINPTDAETALRLVLGSSGLDYAVDDARKTVTIKPLPIRTWTLALGNRRSSFSNGGSSGQSSGQPSSGSAGGGSANGQGGQSGGAQASNSAGSGSQGNGSSPGGSSGGQSGSASGGASGGSNSMGLGFETQEDYWTSIDRELERRLKVMVPVPRAVASRQSPHGALPALPVVGAAMPSMNQPPIPMPAGMMGANQDPSGTASVADLYVEKQIGKHSINPETGAITVQAPHWLLADLDTYFRSTADMFNTGISFEGVLILLSNEKSDSEGLDIQQFASWASGRYGALVSNNGLGGVTLSFARDGNGVETKIPNVIAGAQQVGGALLGITSRKDGLQIFNAYLQERGNSSIVQRPRLSTTSGVPGEYSNIRRDFYTLLSQTASAGNTGSAQQATSNTIVTTEFGTELKIFPRYDIATGLVRAMIRMRSIVKDGEKNVPQVLSTGSTIQTVNQPIPIPRELRYGGEALLRDGDLIVVGGQTEETMQANENGLPSTDGPIGGIFGTKRSSKVGGTYYFALKVSINKR